MDNINQKIVKVEEEQGKADIEDVDLTSNKLTH